MHCWVWLVQGQIFLWCCNFTSKILLTFYIHKFAHRSRYEIILSEVVWVNDQDRVGRELQVESEEWRCRSSLACCSCSKSLESAGYQQSQAVWCIQTISWRSNYFSWRRNNLSTVLCAGLITTERQAVLCLAQMNYWYFVPELCKQTAIFSGASHQNRSYLNNIDGFWR